MASFEWFYEVSRHILEFSGSVWDRALDIIAQPSAHKDMLIVLLPLLATLLVMQIYFSRYRKEELGWGSALGNSIVLIFVGTSLITYLIRNSLFYFTAKTPVSLIKTIIVFVVMLEGVTLAITNFFHATSKKIAYLLSSVLFLNFIAIISVIIVYSDVPLDFITLLSSILIFFILCLFFKIIQMLIPEHFFGEFNEIKESMKKAAIQLKEVKVETKEVEKDHIDKTKEEIKKEREKIRKERERIRNLEEELKTKKKIK